MGEGDGFECPDCGADLAFGQETCPGCGVGVEWEDLETTEFGDGDFQLVDPRLPPQQTEGQEPQLPFSRLGLVWAALTFVSFTGTVLLLRWDTWVQGAAEDNIGDSQRAMVYIGAVTTTVFSVLAILDLLRMSSNEPVSGDLEY